MIIKPLQVFQRPEAAPLACILDDLLSTLDHTLCCHEAHAHDAPPPPWDGEEYVRLLEVYCLLKARLLDVRLRWSAVRESLPRTRFPGFAEECHPLTVASLSSLVDHCHLLMLDLYQGGGGGGGGGGGDGGSGRSRYLLLSQKLGLTDKVRVSCVCVCVCVCVTCMCAGVCMCGCVCLL